MPDDDLFIGLLGAGALFVLGIMLYNQWQIHRARGAQGLDPRTDESARSVWGERREPDLGAASQPLHPGTGLPDAARAPDQDASLEPAGGVIDPLIDCIALLHPEREVSGDRLLPALSRLRRAGTKPIHVEGLNSATGVWEAMRAGQRYLDLQVAVQLANRTGPLNGLEFSEFINAIDPLSEAADATLNLPEMSETLANARELDAFAAACDKQLGVSAISDGAPWSAAYVRTIAAQDGLALSRDGTRFTHFHADAHGAQRPLFTLQFGDTNFLRDDLTVKAGRQITLLLDVPLTSETAKPFKLLCEYAHALSQRMGARVVDDNLRPLTESSFIAIQTHLRGLYDKLEARGIPAGSRAAARLFSH